MKKISLILAVSLGLAACAQSDSDYARKYRTQKTEQGKAEQTAPAGKAITMCDKPAVVICEGLSNMGTKAQAELAKNALDALKKEHSLSEDFDGSPASFAALNEEQKALNLDAELLKKADEGYQILYKYDDDVTEAAEIARTTLIEVVEREKEMSEDDKRHLFSIINTSLVFSVTETLTNHFTFKDQVLTKLKETCGLDGGKNASFSIVPGGGPNGVITICPGRLLRSAGAAKEDRIMSLVFDLSREIAVQMSLRGVKADDSAVACLTGGSLDQEGDRALNADKVHADLWGYKVVNTLLKNEKDIEAKKAKAKKAFRSLCLDGKEEERILNFFKLDTTGVNLSCSNGPRC
ncbi:hypothetical protein EZJ49_03900 [Bdellovibrio bacteriovorus]|uniref:hypothetical protein n=1 Tax=Bdellovibrio bacteriovorus TaxID=959 RepID=UPI0021D331F1|nr:hypothetical protein [Bdellovibrio bacteriovorus]UXR65395.1 hypothetical protein EZJ49_03900 [Bdellovibrio bacteriovorus]